MRACAECHGDNAIDAMLHKSLTTAAWTTFAKSKPYEDKALLKALDGLKNASDNIPRQLAALADIDKQTQLLLKAHKTDKALQTFFKEMGRAAAELQQALLARQRAEEDDARAASSDDDAGPTALTDQLKSLLAVVRRGETLHAMLAYTGKQMAVMLSRRPLSASARGVLNKYLGAAGTKYLVGTCVFESNAHTFVLEARVAGLVKRIRQALNEQTGLRLKVRVRGQDPHDVEEDDETDEAEQGGTESEEASGQTARNADKALGDEQARLACTARLKALQPALAAALQKGDDHAAVLRKIVDSIRALIDKGQYKAALEALDKLQQRLSPTGGTANTGTSTKPAERTAEETRQLIVKRVQDNEALRKSPKFRKDMDKVRITPEHIERMNRKEAPLGFENPKQFVEFKADLDKALQAAGLPDAEIGLKGTATTFYSENPGKPLGHHWDADPENPGDYDLNVTSPSMVKKLLSLGIHPSEKYGIFKTADLYAHFPELQALSEQWGEKLGRDVNLVGCPVQPERDPTEYLLRTPL